MVYYVFMIDLMESKKMDEDARRESQARLKNVKNVVNAFANARVAFSSGDSLQGYFSDAALALRICLLIVYLMDPIAVHCGIGTGEIYVIDEEEGTNASDGPAYHDALRSLERSKNETREIAAHFGIGADALIETALESARLLRNANTGRQNMFATLASLACLSDGDRRIVELGIQSAGLYGAACPDGDVRLDERQHLAHFIARATNTSIQNGYDMIRKSNALFIAGTYRTCLHFLTTI